MKRREAYELALTVAAAGVPVLPVSADSRKRPLVAGRSKQDAGGVHLASTDAQKILSMFKPYRDEEVMVAAHPGPAGYMVLDIDRPKLDEKTGIWSVDGLVTLRDLITTHPQLGTAAIVKTGSGGYHLWFRKPEDEDGSPFGVGCKNGWRPSIDLKSDGGYVIVAGSYYTTELGEERRYEWIDRIDWSGVVTNDVE